MIISAEALEMNSFSTKPAIAPSASNTNKPQKEPSEVMKKAASYDLYAAFAKEKEALEVERRAQLKRILALEKQIKKLDKLGELEESNAKLTENIRGYSDELGKTGEEILTLEGKISALKQECERKERDNELKANAKCYSKGVKNYDEGEKAYALSQKESIPILQRIAYWTSAMSFFCKAEISLQEVKSDILQQDKICNIEKFKKICISRLESPPPEEKGVISDNEIYSLDV